MNSGSFLMNKTFNFEGQSYLHLCKLPSPAPGTEKELKCLFPSPSFLGNSKINFIQCLLWEEVCRTWSYLTCLNRWVILIELIVISSLMGYNFSSSLILWYSVKSKNVSFNCNLPKCLACWALWIKPYQSQFHGFIL